MKNKYGGRCTVCGGWVPELMGVVEKIGGKWKTFHNYHRPGAPPQRLILALEPESPPYKLVTVETPPVDARFREKLPAETFEEISEIVAGVDGRWNKDKQRFEAPYEAGPELVHELKFVRGVSPIARTDEIREAVLAAPPRKVRGKIDATEMAERRRLALGRIERLQAALLPKGMSIRPYQIEGILWLASRDTALQADDMGLGKTLQILVSLPERSRTVVVAPAVAKGVWDRETARWRPDLRSSVLEGLSSFRWPEEGEIVVTSYEILPAIDKMTEPPLGVTIVADEAHKAKEASSGMSQKLRALCNMTGQRQGRAILATATPVLNKPTELWTLLSILGEQKKVFPASMVEDPELYQGEENPATPAPTTSWAAFRHMFRAFDVTFVTEAFDRKTNRMVRRPVTITKWGSPRPGLATYLGPVLIRRTKLDVLRDMPPKTYHTIDVPLTLEGEEAANKLTEIAKTFVTQQEEVIAGGGAAVLGEKLPEQGEGESEDEERLENPQDDEAEPAAGTGAAPVEGEIVDVIVEGAPGAVSAAEIARIKATAKAEKNRNLFTEMSRLREIIARAKMPAMLELVEQYERMGEPVLVFSAHKAPIDALAKRPGWAIITGNTSHSKRRKIEDAFQAGQLRGVGLTIQAGGVAITLTRAATVIYNDRTFVPALNVQSEDRAYRLGQKRPVSILLLVGQHQIERRLEDIIRRKTELFEAAINAMRVQEGGIILPKGSDPIDLQNLQISVVKLSEDVAELDRAKREKEAAERKARLARAEKVIEAWMARATVAYHERELEKQRAGQPAMSEQEIAEKVRRLGKRLSLLAETSVDLADPPRPAENDDERWAIAAIEQLAGDDLTPSLRDDVGFSHGTRTAGNLVLVTYQAEGGMLPSSLWKEALNVATYHKPQVGLPPSKMQGAAPPPPRAKKQKAVLVDETGKTLQEAATADPALAEAVAEIKGPTMRKPKGTPTSTNIYAMHSALVTGLGVIPARVPQADAPHLKRALSAKLLRKRIDGSFEPTQAGIDAMLREGHSYPIVGPDPGSVEQKVAGVLEKHGYSREDARRVMVLGMDEKALENRLSMDPGMLEREKGFSRQGRAAAPPAPAPRPPMFVLPTDLAGVEKLAPGVLYVKLEAVPDPSHPSDPRASTVSLKPYWMPVSSLHGAKKAVEKFIEEQGLLSGNFAGGHVVKDGQLVARISYNGRVFGPGGDEIALPAIVGGKGAEPPMSQAQLEIDRLLGERGGVFTSPVEGDTVLVVKPSAAPRVIGEWTVTAYGPEVSSETHVSSRRGAIDALIDVGFTVRDDQALDRLLAKRRAAAAPPETVLPPAPRAKGMTTEQRWMERVDAVRETALRLIKDRDVERLKRLMTEAREERAWADARFAQLFDTEIARIQTAIVALQQPATPAAAPAAPAAPVAPAPRSARAPAPAPPAAPPTPPPAIERPIEHPLPTSAIIDPRKSYVEKTGQGTLVHIGQGDLAEEASGRPALVGRSTIVQVGDDRAILIPDGASGGADVRLVSSLSPLRVNFRGPAKDGSFRAGIVAGFRPEGGRWVPNAEDVLTMDPILTGILAMKQLVVSSERYFVATPPGYCLDSTKSGYVSRGGAVLVHPGRTGRWGVLIFSRPDRQIECGWTNETTVSLYDVRVQRGLIKRSLRQKLVLKSAGEMNEAASLLARE